MLLSSYSSDLAARKVIKQTSEDKFLHDYKTTANLLKSTDPNIFLVPREPSNYRIKES